MEVMYDLITRNEVVQMSYRVPKKKFLGNTVIQFYMFTAMV